MVWLLLAGCATESDLPYASGGRRVSSSYNDSGGDDSGDSGATAPGAPVIDDMSAYFELNDEIYDIKVVLVYHDGQDDVEGGKVFFDVTEGTGSAESSDLSIVNKLDYEPSKSEAYIDPDQGTDATHPALIFFIAPVSGDKDYAIDSVQIKDSSGNTSESASHTVAAGSYTP